MAPVTIHATPPKPSTNINFCCTLDREFTERHISGSSMYPLTRMGRLMPLSFKWQHYSDRVKRFSPADWTGPISFVQGA